MTKKIKKVIVEVPHRISGFFEIVDELNGVKIDTPEKIGSRGAGFCIDVSGITEIEAEPKAVIDDIAIEIYINDEKVNQKAETTYYIVDYVKNYIKHPWKIRINHYFNLPVGCGYGASGSGALGTIFGLDYLFDLNFSFSDKGKIAHISEVENKTGLGTICGQLGGGLGILREPGFPCVYERLKVPRDIKIVCGSLGMIHTKSILTDPVLSLKIKEVGKKALIGLIQEPTIKTFINESINFVKDTEILEKLHLYDVKELMYNLNKLDIIGASMNQLGRSVYAICKKDNEKRVLDVFESFKPEIKIFTTMIHGKKAIYLKKG
ncbi:MAG: hypothetical protein ACFE9Z_06480 [Promethearchaeota archaeon]